MLSTMEEATLQSPLHSKAKAKKTSTTRNNRGTFLKSVWYCDCEPRLPAEHFKVKKQGKNHGRWFYTCQKDPEERCKFFLWGEEAMMREKETVLNNARSEAPQNPRKSRGLFDGISLSDELALAQSVPDLEDDETESETEEVNTPSKMRSLPLTSEQKQTSFSDAGLQKKLFQNMSTIEIQPSTTNDYAYIPETPKMDRAVAAYATPAETTGRKRVFPWEMANQTANKKAIENHSDTPSKKTKLDTGDPSRKPISNHVLAMTTEQELRPITPVQKEQFALPETPAPARFKDAMAPAGPVSFNWFADIEKELAPLKLPPAVMSKVRGHVKRHETLAAGFKKARDKLREDKQKLQAQLALQAKPEQNLQPGN